MTVSDHETVSASDLAARDWVVNRPSRNLWPKLDLRELWRYRDVGVLLAQRDLKVRYKQTFFGVAWAVIQPLIAMILFTLVLHGGVGVSGDGVPYAAFAIAGLAVWFPFNTAVIAAADSLVRDPELVTKVYFPRLLAPFGATLASAADLAVALVIAVIVALFAGLGLSLSMLALPLCAVVAMAVSLAFGVWLSALNVLYRDVRYALSFAMQVLFFVSPVVYPSSVAGSAEDVLALNPLVGVIGLLRWSLLGISPPVVTLVISLGSTVVLLATGLVYFRRAERQFADRI
jgi:ABC-type polysaccharide/polyol phosphate export permease